MPPRVNQCLAMLIELSEGRSLIMTGKLKSLRADMREVLTNPSDGADLLAEATKDAKRFSRHLGSIKGSIKSLYDQIKGNIPARDIVASYFDDFIREILIRDYATIKTTENPLSIRDELLSVVTKLRYNDEKKTQLLKGYLILYNHDAVLAKSYMDKDLNQLEIVFTNIENQLDAIDSMKLKYEMRIDTVIDYASRTPKPLSKIIKRLITSLSEHAKTHPDDCYKTSLTHGELLSHERLYRPKKERVPVTPRKLKKSKVSDSILSSSKKERAARNALKVNVSVITKFLSIQMGQLRTIESTNLKPITAQDYFCMLAIQRIANKPKGVKSDHPSLMKAFDFTRTNELIETTYIHANKVIITKKVIHEQR